ncbi:hypothetical protein BCR44DRAFT_1387121 [Catenaria anguillulae PL171]|uniref:THIF-type NAD/FAD binding fold domain-containing protein n=1 Tax=Catenaria anguillulae PL171 TaxID=765915 RepID=A0A1Y2HYM5_9FUNG|nr:hypothetical protein BCR44DRAFT_1387121 [Catenaria anguillulae PL171]
MDESLVREQLARHYVFFGDDGMAAIRKAKVVVVGVGGVGSHAAHMLARGGVGFIRIIDFDQVTLSSLNRHAVATFSDVGTPKVMAMMRRLGDIAPHAQIDPINKLFSGDAAEELLLLADGSKPDFVIDAIDHLPSKVALIAYCKQHGIPVIASMGSGAKADPSRIFLCDISETTEDPLARSVRYQLRKQYGIDHNVPVVYSTERATPGLGLIQPGAAGSTDLAEFAPLPTFRASILPVMGPLPAMFGNALAATVLSHLATFKCLPLPTTRPSRTKDYAKLVRDLAKECEKHLSASKVSTGVQNGAAHVQLTLDDVAVIVEDVWGMRSAVSQRVDKLVLVPWRPHERISVGNVVPMAKDEAEHHWSRFSRTRDPAHDAWLEGTWPGGVAERVGSVLKSVA